MNSLLKPLLILAAFLGIVLALFIFLPASSGQKIEGERITIGEAELSVEIADTPELQKRGLSGRTALAEGHGMFFVFPEPGRYGFWMKDMLFPIDIIWIDGSGAVVGAVSADPASYPEVFYPPVPVSYVLEVPRGFAEKNHIETGSLMNR